ncbi:YkvA family protein [Thermomonospora catenispora]|uniref:YkvA family protein n=1 Tax=Thermomonospora catenispora TaxID=2493090 RepID=UPI001F4F49CD|nr:YkvA family protein [Thermomonospora catenispora]
MRRKRRMAVAAGQAWRIYRETHRPGAPGLRERIEAVPGLLRDTVRGDYPGLGHRRLALLLLALVYVISPVDVLPEVLPLIGVADDLGVAMWAATTLIAAAGEYLHWRRGRPAVGEPVAATVTGSVG